MKTGKSILFGVLFSGLACLFGMVSCNSQPTEEQAQAALEKKGGMVVTLAPDVPGMLYALSDYNQSEDFKEALEAAKTCAIKDDYLSTFVYAYGAFSGFRLSSTFCTYELRDRITYSSSNQEVEAVLREEIETTIHNSAVVLQTRLYQYGIKNAFVKVTEDNRIIALIPDVQDPERVRHLMQADGRLEFWETYELYEIKESLQQINAALDMTVFDIVTLGSEGLQGPEMALCPLEDTAQINAVLTSGIAKNILPRDVRFKWTTKPVNERAPYYYLIALKARRDGRATLYGDIITKAKVVHNKGYFGPVIDITMNQEGARTWRRFTRENIGKYIAVVVDDQLYAYPRIMTEIEGEKCQIAANLTQEEAEDLANMLSSGILPCHVNIVEEQIIEPQK